jgi:hypothetical protein
MKEDAHTWARRSLKAMLKRLLSFMASEHERAAAELREALDKRKAAK